MSPSTTITRRNLPHWTKEGAIYWVTFRLADSLPQDKLRAWIEERDIWRKAHPEPWTDAEWTEYDDRFGKCLDEWLDAGYGSRALARSDVREVVRDCLMKFDDQRVRVHAAVIMPTHVHALLEPLETNTLSQLLKGIKGASARRANKLLGVSGTFWMDESYDHIVRSEKQYRHFLRYVEENPRKANLGDSEYWLLKGDTDIPVCGLHQNAQAGMPVSPSAIESRIRSLLAYDDEMPEFSESETENIIQAIDELKALDPAVGSGAFPMGMLHKLVHVLGRLDPGNERWKAKQIAKLDDATMREDAERIFRENYDDYGRKLYLIENCIYGVDIQPIAVQIAKMRFFISLIVDQKVDGDTGIPACGSSSQTRMSVLPNRGVRALPNLETKFVAANTLIGIEKPEQMLLRNPDIDRKEAELRKVREKHFTARTLKSKAKCREDDKRLRSEIATLLKTDGWDNTTAKQLASWDPYDQNAHADFFDPEWMFGIQSSTGIPACVKESQTGMSAAPSGFDIVIGNPPYVRQEAIKEFKAAFSRHYACYTGVADLYVYFYEQAVRLLANGGVLSFISSNKWYRAAYGEKLRKYLAERMTFHRLIDFGDAPVFTAIAYPTIVVAQKAKADNVPITALNWNPAWPLDDFAARLHTDTLTLAPADLKPDGWRIENPASLRLLEKLRKAGTPLGDYVKGRFYRGVLTGLNEAFVVDRATRDRLIAEHPSSAEVLKPFLRGRDVKRWRCEPQDLWLIFTRRGIDIAKYPAIHEHLKPFKNRLTPGIPGGRKPGSYQWFEIQDNIAYWKEFEQPKILYQEIATYQAFAWEDSGAFSNNKTFLIPDGSKMFLAVLNSAVCWWFLGQIASKLQGGAYAMQAPYVSQIPIPSATPDQQSQLESLVTRILAAKKADPTADTSALEREIDEQVYNLYGLTAEEIAIVEGKR